MARVKSFVIFAGMRTGSNLLEDTLNGYAGLKSFGEVFNPVFVGGPRREQLFGMDLEARQKDPEKMLRKIRQKPDQTGGFRYFYDHEPRVFEPIIEDPTCAKVLLTRNPLESFVSLQIAAATGQWRLMNESDRKTAKILFDPAAFETHLKTVDAFRARVRRGLQCAGQSAFEIDYCDLQDVDVLNGLAAFLGSPERKVAAESRLKRQNPGPLSDKVTNPDEMNAVARSFGIAV